MSGQAWAWVIFNAAVLMLLILDLTVLQRHGRAMRIREALGWSAFWVGLAMAFNVLLYYAYREHWGGFGLNSGLPAGEAAMQFLTGYIIELSLSVDNLFVFLAIFKYFHVTGRHQHRVLFWGILGAVVLRAAMILLGVQLIVRFHWLLYLLGAFLVITGVKLAMEDSESRVHPEKNILLRLARRVFPIAPGDHEGRFFRRVDGKMMVTSLLLVLLVVESTDLLFAMDSIPAILAITKDPYIAYTSNIFAVLGLRALYFALAGLIGLFEYLKYGLAAVLVFVGLKMLGEELVHVSIGVSLSVVGGLLALSIVASLLHPGGKLGADAPPESPEDREP